ncbi:HIT family protein [Brucella anthropi]|nr:HIT domain-containing protein [Brucella anthropi]
MNKPGCRWCAENDMLGGKPLAQNRSHFLMAKDHASNPAAMIIPHHHVETPFDFTAEEWADLGHMLGEAKNRLAEFNPDGFTVGWNIGAAGGQHIFHAHMQVICRFADEPSAGQGLRDFLRTTT